MKIDIVRTNLEVSGTTKYMGALAHAFATLGHDVRFLYTGVRPGWELVEPVLEQVVRVRYAGELSHRLSIFAFGNPLLKLFAQGTFAPDQSVNVVGNTLAGNRFRHLTDGSDLVIYSNGLAYPPARIITRRKPPEVLLFQEAIGAEFLPRVLRYPLQVYFRQVARRVDASIATTQQMGDHLRVQGVPTRTIYPGFFPGSGHSSPKEPLVLADSRWVKERQPARIVAISRLVPGGTFVMVGGFPDRSQRDRIIGQIRNQELENHVDLRGPVPERDLQELYARARIVIRWAQEGMEDGFSWSLENAVSAGCIPVLSKGLGGAYHLAKEVSPELVAESDKDFARIINRLLTDEPYYLGLLQKVLAWRERRPWTAVAQSILEVLPGRQTI